MNRTKKIGIDARLYHQTGVGTYVRNLLHYLPQIAPDDMLFYIYMLPSEGTKLQLPPDQFTIREIDATWHSLREQTTFYDALMTDELDLMHFTYFGYPVRYIKPFIATVHDLTPLLFKTGRASTLHPFLYEFKYQTFKFVLSQQIKNAQTIITPTYAVKNQILERFGTELDKKIIPILEGINYELTQATENTSLQKRFNEPFLLYVGNFYPHKNVGRLIEAFKAVQDENHLVLVGPDNMFAQQLQDQLKQEHITKVHFYHKATNEDLVFFYKHAQALVNPSLSEGFGLPLFEAAYFNCPVIASDIPVFHELLGNDFISFDPEKVKDIVEKLQITSSVIPDSIRNPDASRFSFEKMTKETMKLYLQEGTA